MPPVWQNTSGEQMTTCAICKKEFTSNKNWHHETGLCGDACRTIARREAKAKYKKTEKGISSNEKWVNSEKRKENEKRYRSTPKRRHLSVLASSRFLKKHPEAMEKKREQDRIFARSERGKEINKASRKRYKQTERGRMIIRISRMRRRHADGSFTPEEWNEKLILFGGACAHCGSKDSIEADHVVPIKKGGSNYIDNIQPLCRSCNASKGARYVG